MAGTIELVGADKLEEALKRMSFKHPDMEKQARKIMAEVIKVARREISKAAKGQLPNDPRKAYQAVRSSVYKRIFGGQVNILARRKNNGKMWAGGNHRSSRPRSSRTQDLQGYYGSDRGFILRFLNAGTRGRVASTMNAHAMKRKSVSERSKSGNYKTGTIGARGSIAARGWFEPAANQTMQKAAEQWSELIDRAIVELWN